MKEIWRDIEGYEGLYKVSNLGNVKCMNYRNQKKEQIKKAIKNDTGYFCLSLWKNGNPKNMRVHRLVAMAFIPNPQNKPCINHKDGDKINNKINNFRMGNI